MSQQLSLTVRNHVVAVYEAGDDLPASLSPRPYLHPIRTLAGTVVTASHPSDHPWHLGAGLAIQDVAGVNFWGGPTYVRGRGYVELADHGHIEHLGWRGQSADRLVQDLRWVGPDGEELLREDRSVAVSAVDTAPGWALHFRSSLRNTTGAPLRVSSPAANGRQGAGYGGFFWRAPHSATPWQISTATGEGEAQANGSCSSWLRIGGRGAGANSDYTLVFAVPVPNPDAPSTDRPWFVRSRDYPGVCSAVAFDRAVLVEADERLEIGVSVLVADGVLDQQLVADFCRGIAGQG